MSARIDATTPGATAARTGARRWPRSLVAGVILLGLVAVLGVASVFWLPFDLADTSGGRLEAPNGTHWLGTDTLGRDTASFVLVGLRIALTVGLGSTAIALAIGLVVGLVAAHSSGWLDDVQSSLLDVLIAFPTLLLAMLIGATQGASLTTAVVSIGVAASAVVARLTRILAKRLLRQQFVVAARTSGTGWFSIIVRHLLPNMWPTLVVTAALVFGTAVLAEASLSYLGLGVPPPNASLGRLLRDSQSTVLGAPWSAIAPGVAVVIIVLGANFLADGLREHLDPTRRGRS
ncbi:ABC transporter permease [Tessaracoccus caeni]|uniref:ABC transporter permease n=1 Tax=Tessaracoccus caeni TaxID=3031239 RepID=UPI0023DBF269|nr:ABC transporter permease [Tessaracoccus caeni]MDF1487380.1 ABC transporter permease [Tessaracoccus caeni]